MSAAVRHAIQQPERPLLAAQSPVDLHALQANFQPIFNLATGALHGFEGLIRPPRDSGLCSAFELFALARAADMSIKLEQAAAQTLVRRFTELGLPGTLSLNFSCDTLLHLGAAPEQVDTALREIAHLGDRLVIEVTEQDVAEDVGRLVAAIDLLRHQRGKVALDDFGMAQSSLALWIQLQPEVLKLDRFFVAGIDGDSRKFETVKSIVQLAATLGSEVVAEGIERIEELIVLRDLGVQYGQGFLLGRPSAEPVSELPAKVWEALGNRAIAVFPEPARIGPTIMRVDRVLNEAPCVGPTTSNNELLRVFHHHPELTAVAIVSDDGHPVGVVNRRSFIDTLSLPFHEELFGRRPCTLFMDTDPILVERSASFDELADIITDEDQRYLYDGFIITENGRYVGLGTGSALVRMVTENRIEAARYANPLTFLPGNIPISRHIDRLLQSQTGFVACYCDLDHFKPFNDQYGYWKGDEMIKLAAACLTQSCNPLRDFLGHVGGDDFLVLFQSDDWQHRLLAALEQFRLRASTLFNDEDRARGGIEAEDRQGRMAFFPLTTMSAGALRVHTGHSLSHEKVASRAAAAKRAAKQGRTLLHVEEA
ncbi:MAG: EAL domain-containing protein [Rhodocyclaceae bacterium]